MGRHPVAQPVEPLIRRLIRGGVDPHKPGSFVFRSHVCDSSKKNGASGSMSSSRVLHASHCLIAAKKKVKGSRSLPGEGREVYACTVASAERREQGPGLGQLLLSAGCRRVSRLDRRNVQHNQITS